MIFIFETFNHQGFISAEFTLLTDYTVKAMQFHLRLLYVLLEVCRNFQNTWQGHRDKIFWRSFSTKF